MGNVEVDFSYEGETVLIEGLVDLDLYYEPADPSVGFMSDSFTPDGWEISEVTVTLCDEDGETVDSYECKGKPAAEWLPGLRERNPELAKLVTDCIDKTCEDFAQGYEPDYEPDPPDDYY